MGSEIMFAVASERLQYIVDQLGIDYTTLGRYAGVSKQAARKWCTGESKGLNMKNLFKIEAMTGYSARWIATGEGAMLLKDVSLLTDDELAMVQAYRMVKKSKITPVRPA